MQAGLTCLVSYSENSAIFALQCFGPLSSIHFLLPIQTGKRGAVVNSWTSPNMRPPEVFVPQHFRPAIEYHLILQN